MGGGLESSQKQQWSRRWLRASVGVVVLTLLLLTVRASLARPSGTRNRPVKPTKAPVSTDPAPRKGGARFLKTERVVDRSKRYQVREIDRGTRDRINLGLRWLATRQSQRGFWEASDDGFRVAVSALSGLALLASGSTYNRGPYSKNVTRLCRALIREQIRTNNRYNGLFWDRSAALVKGPRIHGQMHGHGLALLFLSQLYGEVHEAALRAKLKKSIQSGIQLTVNAQNKDGGWWYLPGDERAECSVTVTQVQALRSAREAGFIVPIETIKNAIRYIHICQVDAGGMRYGKDKGNPTAALTGAGIKVLHDSGRYAGDDLDRAYRYLESTIEYYNIEREEFFFYAHFYAAQAFYARGGVKFQKYYQYIQKILLKNQRTNGAWKDIGYGANYRTANALLILQVPKAYLPVFQR